MMAMKPAAESHAFKVRRLCHTAGWVAIGAALMIGCSSDVTGRAEHDLPVITQEQGPSTGIRGGAPSGDRSPQPAADELLITFKPDTPEARRQAILEAVGTPLLRQMLNGRIVHVKLREGQTLAEAQAAYEKFAEVEAAEPNYSMEMLEHTGPAR